MIMVNSVNSHEKVDFKYFIKLALSRNISWHVVTLLFDESTLTFEKSKELNVLHGVTHKSRQDA